MRKFSNQERSLTVFKVVFHLGSSSIPNDHESDHLEKNERTPSLRRIAYMVSPSAASIRRCSADNTLPKRLIRGGRTVFKGAGLPVVSGPRFRQPARQRHHKKTRQHFCIRLIHRSQLKQGCIVARLVAQRDS